MTIYLGPFTRALQWKPGVKSGFLLWPHTLDGVGWGEGEIITESGGTETTVKSYEIPGGRNQNVLLGFKDQQWGTNQNAVFQAAGNIDWVGKLASPTSPDISRTIMTVNGPLSRYWNLDGAYAYDGNPKAEEIYLKGRIAAVAPHPVLGACLQAGRLTRTAGGIENVTWIIAMCKVGVQDMAFARPLKALVMAQDLDAARADMRMMADPFTNEYGWRLVGTNVGLPPDEPYPPEAPWFFSSAGTEGRTMRRAHHTFDPGSGTSTTEDVFYEYKCAIVMTATGPIVSFTVPETMNELGFKYTEDHLKEQSTYPKQPSEPAGDDWTEDHIQQLITLTGDLTVCVDYDYARSEWVRGSIVVVNSRRHSQYWMSRYLARTPTGIRRLVVGRTRPSTQVMAEGDHYDSAWIGDNSYTKLRVKKLDETILFDFYLGYGMSGSSTVASGQPWTASDPYLYFWDSLDFWLHHFDLRTKLVAGYSRVDQLQVTDTGFQFFYETLEWAGKGEDEALTDTPSSTKITRFSSPVVDAVNAFGFDFYVMKNTWAPTFTVYHERTNFTAAFPVLTVPLNRADWRSYYNYPLASWATAENQCWRRRSIPELFNDPNRNLRPGVYGSLPTGAAIVAYEFYDETIKEMSHYERLWPEPTITVVDPNTGVPVTTPAVFFNMMHFKGPRYHPGGIV